jgi:hypothetical protein
MAVVHFGAALTIPAGTPDDAPAESEVVTAPGRAILLRVFVPPGPRGEVHLRLDYMERRVAPVPPATWDNLDDDLVDWPLDIPLPPGETRFTLAGSSPGASFPHTIPWEVHVDTTPPAEAPAQSTTLLGRLAGILSS